MEGLVRGKHEFRVDERDKLPPVGSGQDWYPTPVDYMLSSLAACQTAVLTQCLSKSRVDEFEIHVTADIDDRDDDDITDEMPEHTSSRIAHIDIDVQLTVPEELASRAERCLEVYDQGCIVGQSFRRGIEYTPTTSLETVE